MKHQAIKGLTTAYQPIFDIRTKKIIGYEALTRGRGKWRLPEGLFRHSYEQGFTIALDLECMWQALKILPKLGDKLLFVNIEPMTLEHAFAKGVEGDFILKKIQHHSGQIIFELTEGMKGRDFKLMKRGVGLIRKHHCRFAIDDVAGIGFKLFRLLTLQPDFLKIDISLIRGLVKNPLHQELVHRLIALGRKNRSLIIAEGLEQKEDVQMVRKIGIPYVQGFYFARPKKILLKG